MGKLNILLVEDKPEDITPLFEIKDIRVEHIETSGSPYQIVKGITDTIEKNTYDLLLVDLKLGKEENKKGERVLELLSLKKIPIPVMVLSWTHTTEEISKLVREGYADWYVHKTQLHYFERVWEKYRREILKIPEKLEEVLNEDDEGNNKNILHFLINFLTLTRRHSGMLWYGIKPLHVIDHGYVHSQNLWNMVYSFAADIFKGEENKELVLAFCLSVWLHDIGMKGGEPAVFPWEVRKEHGLISAYLLYHYFDDYIFKLPLPSNIDKEKLKRYLMILSAYHHRRAPVDEETVKKIGGEEEVEEVYRENTRYEYFYKLEEDGILCLKNGIFYTSDKNLRRYIAWFRFIDALDFHGIRVGWREEELIRMRMNYEEILAYAKEYLDKESERRIKSEYERWLDKLYPKEEREKKKRENDESRVETILKFYRYINRIPREKDPKKRQLRFLMQAPLHYFTHRLIRNVKVEQPQQEKSKDKKWIIKYYLDVDVDKESLRKDSQYFSYFSYIFRECWKIANYVKGDYFPVSHLLSENEMDIELHFILTGEEGDKRFKFSLNKLHLEQELKYTFDTVFEAEEFLKAVFTRILDFPFSRFPSYDELQRDQYYDTREDLLWKNGWTLRKRKKAGKTKWTVKVMPLMEEPGASTRIEVEGDSRNNVFSQMEKIYGIIKDVLPKGDLEVKKTLTTRRKKCRVRWHNACFEISLDVTRDISQNNRKEGELAMVEIELKDEEKVSAMFLLEKKIKEKTGKAPTLLTKYKWARSKGGEE